MPQLVHYRPKVSMSILWHSSIHDTQWFLVLPNPQVICATVSAAQSWGKHIIPSNHTRYLAFLKHPSIPHQWSQSTLLISAIFLHLCLLHLLCLLHITACILFWLMAQMYAHPPKTPFHIIPSHLTILFHVILSHPTCFHWNPLDILETMYTTYLNGHAGQVLPTRTQSPKLFHCRLLLSLKAVEKRGMHGIISLR